MAKPAVSYMLVRRRDGRGIPYYALRIEVEPWATAEDKVAAAAKQRKFSSRVSLYAYLAAERRRGKSALTIALRENRYILAHIRFAAELAPDMSQALLKQADRRLRYLRPRSTDEDRDVIQQVLQEIRAGIDDPVWSDEFFVTAKDIENRLAQWGKVWGDTPQEP